MGVRRILFIVIPSVYRAHLAPRIIDPVLSVAADIDTHSDIDIRMGHQPIFLSGWFLVILLDDFSIIWWFIARWAQIVRIARLLELR
ncbi:hypothetical protein [Novosphingobium resinovorum]|uniref:hypothetical protein n=1 Tax=Novosphingobium resinovorum TaxID=158500 RepID=UPI002ED5E0BF|nr:hypothetical protein [Novosphingobium resinovorum]